MPIDPGTHVGPVALRVTDLDRSRDFYSEALGLQALDGGDGVTRMSADGRSALVELDARESAGGAPAPPRATGLFHLALLYPSRAALGRSVAIDTIPLDLGEILAEAAETNGGADPGTVMGHVHLKVSDLERSIAFYRDALGLDLQAQLGPQAAFLAAGGYHHHVGINVWHSRGGGPPPPGSAGLAWFVLELPSLDALAETGRALRDAGHEVDEHNGTFAVRDPDGIALRLRAS
jgi:catechol 2,3-dioxygenase